MSGGQLRTHLKRGLALAPEPRARAGTTVLIYHRVGGGSRDELDVPVDSFEAQLDVLVSQPVVPLGDAVSSIETGQASRAVVISFDDGFREVYENAWPRLRERRLPFTVYLASGYVGRTMRWEGSTARDRGAVGLTWTQLDEMVSTGLCTVGNHTHTHVRPELLTEAELDSCTEAIARHLDVVPQHFAFPWGRPVAAMDDRLRARFRSAATGRAGVNTADTDLMRLARVPVRRSDPIEFFRSKLGGGLVAERLYTVGVATAKRVGIRG